VLRLTAGFLLAVLWFDLMFDVQVLGGGPVGEPLAEPVLASIAAYYRHVTTSARPMSYLVGLVMLVTMGGTLIQVFVGRGPVAIRSNDHEAERDRLADQHAVERVSMERREPGEVKRRLLVER